MTEFKPLHALQAEQSVLGGLLINNSAFDEIHDIISEQDFYQQEHKIIYWVIKILAAKSQPFDILTVCELLKQNGELENIGGEIYIFELARNTPTAANIKAYAEIVKRKSLERKVIAAAQDVIKSVVEQKENCVDFAQQAFANIADQTTTETVAASDILKTVISSIDERRINQNSLIGISTGFIDLDKITHGLHGGDLIILAGRPSMGKTVLAGNIAEHAALHEKSTVVVFSLEMSKEQLVERSLSSVSRVEADRLRSGKLLDSDYQKIQSALPAYHNKKLFIDDRAALSVADIRAKCRRIKREHGLSLVVVDYITLMSATDGENETLRIGSISRGLKLLARDLNVPVIAISQLNRSLEQRVNKRPCMADLRQSGAIEQDADLILFIYRDEVYNENSPARGTAELIIAKQRNGDIGTVRLAFNNRFCRFDNCTNAIVQFPPQATKATWKGRHFEYV